MRITIISCIQEAYTSILKDGYEMETFDGEVGSIKASVALKVAKNIYNLSKIDEVHYRPPAK